MVRTALLLEHALLHEVDELRVRQPQDPGVDPVVTLPASGIPRRRGNCRREEAI
jgi:hypothetical protein